MLLLLSIIFMVTEAFYEASKDKTLGGSIEFVNRSLSALFFILWMIGIQNPIPADVVWWKAILGYLLLREAIFDYIYNWVAGLKFDYIGKTKNRDKFYRWLFKKVPGHFILWIRICVGIMGVAFLSGLSN